MGAIGAIDWCDWWVRLVRLIGARHPSIHPHLVQPLVHGGAGGAILSDAHLGVVVTVGLAHRLHRMEGVAAGRGMWWACGGHVVGVWWGACGACGALEREMYGRERCERCVCIRK